MIEAFVGLIGGGKSFSAVARMAEYIASGGVVCTNIQLMLEPWYNYRYAHKLKSFTVKYPVDSEHLHFENNQFYANARGLKYYLKTKYNWDLQPGQIIDLDNEQISGALHEHLPTGTVNKPVLVVVDEAVDFFDTDDRSTANREFLTFLRYSRKLNIDLIMIAQEFSELNKRIRNQVQWVWTFKDLGIERVPVLRMRYPPPYRFNIAGAQWSGRTFGSLGYEPVKIHMRRKDQAIFGCYRTEELFREVKVLRDVKTDFSKESESKGKVRKMNKFERLALVASLVISVIGFFRRGEEVSVVPEVNAAERSRDSRKGSVAKSGVEKMSLEEIAVALEALNAEEELLIAYCADDRGVGSITTDYGNTYRNGDYHNGNLILRIVKNGYLYMTPDGELSTYKFKLRRKRVYAPEEESEDLKLASR